MAVTTIDIDYYEELKNKEEFVDLLVKNINKGDVKLIFTGPCQNEIMGLFSKLKLD